MAKEPAKKEEVVVTEGEGAAAAAAIGISPEAQQQIDELKGKLELSDAARQDAETRANKNASTAKAAISEVDEANMNLVTNAIETVIANQSTLKARYAEALAANDYSAAADINSEMSENSAKLLHLKNGKAAMEEERKNPPRKADPIVLVDPVEDLASKITPRSAAWVRAHPEYVTNKKLNKAMIRAHEDAIDEGCPPDSDKYFDYVEKELKIGKFAPSPAKKEEDDEDEAETPVSEAAKGKERVNGDDAAPPAMPANRGGSGGGAPVRLTLAQKEAAAESGLTEEQYAANLADLKKQGRITTH